MAAIEPSEVSPSGEYLAIFQRYITRSLDALYARIAPDLETLSSKAREPSFIPHPSSLILPDLEELSSEVREQAWHLLDYGLKLGSAWTGVRRLLLALAPQMEQGSFRHEWLPYLETAVISSRRAQDASAEAQLSLYLGRLYRLRGELASAQSWLMASAALFRQLDDARGRAMALNQLGYVARLQSSYAGAKGYVEEAERLLDAQDIERATCQWVLATVAQDQMEWAEAEDHHRAALRMWQDAGDQRRAAWTLQNLGNTLRSAGYYHEAAAYIQQAIVVLGQLHDLVNQAIARMNLGVVYIYGSEPEQARALFALAEPIFRQVGDLIHLAMVYTNLTIVERDLGHWQAAEDAAKKAIRLWENLDNLRHLANTLDELGVTYLAQSRHAEATAAFEQALESLSRVEPDPFHDMIRSSVLSHLEEARQAGSA